MTEVHGKTLADCAHKFAEIPGNSRTHNITVTQEMIDAGTEELMRALGTRYRKDDHEQTCVAVFQAMLTKGRIFCIPNYSRFLERIMRRVNQ